jgi:hypothetical protein
VLEVDEGRVAGVEPVAPLDDDRSLVEQLVQAEVAELAGCFDPIQVDMGKLDTSRVDANQLEGGARDRSGRSRTTRQAADEGGLPRSQLAGQQDHVPGPQALAEMLSDGFGLRRRAGDLLTQSGRSR